MDRLTKILVIISNLAALYLLAWLISRGFPPILVPTSIAFTVALGAAMVLGDVAMSVALGVTYFVPAFVFWWLGHFSFGFNAIWLAALAGAMLPRSIRTGWIIPRPWRTPFIYWALALALVWPIVVLREVDFYPPLIGRGNLWLSTSTASPPIVTSWMASVAAITMTAILLLDWLVAAFGADKLDSFERRIVRPMLGGVVVAALVAACQSLFNTNFLNKTFFGALGRAVGTMRDSNVLGMCAALWTGVAAAYGLSGLSAGRIIRGFVGLMAFAVLFMGVWASGSRTALLTALCSVLFAIASSWRVLSMRHVLIAGGVAAALGAAIALFPATAAGPWQRLMASIPGFTRDGLTLWAQQLWDRDLYGTAAEHMIREHPMVGIGVGAYHNQYSDHLLLLFNAERPPDNAQNWYRHQLAEFGVLGSLGWIAWLSMFVWLLFRKVGFPEHRYLAGGVKGGLVGCGLASLFGMPAQDPAVTITFIVIAGWCLMLSHRPRVAASALWSGFEWLAVMAVLACFLGGTAYVARFELRPPMRSLRAGFPFQYGFSPPDPQNPGMRWASRRAVDIFHPEKRWLRLELGAVASDAAENPVRVTVHVNQKEILRVDRRSSFPIVRYVRLPDGPDRVMLQIDVGRTWLPADVDPEAEPDQRERGVAVGQWTFEDWPPPGAATIDAR